MKRVLKTSAALAAISALLSPAALAGPCGSPGEAACPVSPDEYTIVEQIQLGDAFADLSVQVPDGSTDAVGTSAAYGNVASGLVEYGSVSWAPIQRMEGDAAARTVIEGDAEETAIATTVSYGNSNSAGSWSGDANNNARQTMTGDTAARSYVYLRGTQDVAVASTGAANVSAVQTEWGTIRNFVSQESTGSVETISIIEAESTSNSAQSVSTSLGNSTSSSGYASTNYTGAVQTTAEGESITALATYRSESADGTVIAASTASGNTATAENQWGFVSLGREGSEVYQEQRSEVRAASYVVVEDLSGFASSSAYGVGNSALVSNMGADTSLYAIQNNYGDVITTAEMTGTTFTDSGAAVSSTAIGNAASAYVCSTCGEATVQGRTYQSNAGNQVATARFSGSGTGSVVGSAVAVGNTATYQSSGMGQ